MSSKLQAKIREIIEKPELFEPRQSNGIYLETVPEWQARALEKQIGMVFDERGEALKKVIQERDDLVQWKKSMMEVESSCDMQAIGRKLGMVVGQDIHPILEGAIDRLLTERDNARNACRLGQATIDALRAQVLDLERDKKELAAQLERNTQAGLDLAKERDHARKEWSDCADENGRLRAEIERLKFTVSATKTLRDELAMAALPTLAPLFAALQEGSSSTKYDTALIMDWAYQLADEGMKRREITVENA